MTNTKKVVLTLGGKGGTGKTLFCRTLFHMLNAEEVQTSGLDADRENPEFWDYHQDEAKPVQRLDFLEVKGARKFISRLEKYRPQVALLDMPGASGAATREQFIRFDIFNTLKHELDGYEITVVAVLNECFNAIGSLEVMMGFLGKQANYVAVLSNYWALSQDNPFKRWHACEAYNQFLRLDGKEVTLPILEIDVFDTLHERSLPFSKLNDLPLGDKVLVRSYLTRARASFDTAHDYLGLPPLDGRDTNELINQGIATLAQKQTKSNKSSKKANQETSGEPSKPEQS